MTGKQAVQQHKDQDGSAETRAQIIDELQRELQGMDTFSLRLILDAARNLKRC